MTNILQQSLAIYGGTFNPVHQAHVEVALACDHHFHFDRFHILPSSLPAYKAKPISAKHRLNMLRLAFAKYQHFKIDTREMQRDGVTKTIDTVKELKQIFASQYRLFFIIGSDSWLSFNTWDSWREIFDYVNIIIVKRIGFTVQLGNGYANSDTLLASSANVPTSYPAELQTTFEQQSVREKDEFLQSPSGQIFYLDDVSVADISSTAIRQDIAQGKITQDVLTPQVRAYIDKHYLYQIALPQE